MCQTTVKQLHVLQIVTNTNKEQSKVIVLVTEWGKVKMVWDSTVVNEEKWKQNVRGKYQQEDRERMM